MRSTAPLPARTREPLATVAEVAEYLHQHPQTIRKWERQGKLVRVTGIGRSVRFRWADVDAAIGLNG